MKGQFYNSSEVEYTKLKPSAWLTHLCVPHKSFNSQSFMSAAWSQGLFQQYVCFRRALYLWSLIVSPLMSVKNLLRGSTLYSVLRGISTGLKSRLRPGYKSWLYYLLAVWPCINDLTFLSLSVLTYKMGIILPALQCCREVKWGYLYKEITMVPTKCQQAPSEFIPFLTLGGSGRLVNRHFLRSRPCGVLMYREKKAVMEQNVWKQLAASASSILEKVTKCEWQRLSQEHKGS